VTQTHWAHRFDTFVRRKERQAREAAVEGFLTLADHSDRFTLERIGSPWTHDRFDGPFYRSSREDGRSLSLVFVRSREGNTVAEDPGSLGGGSTDQHLVYEGLSRVDADAVLAGAGTVLGSDVLFSVWHPELVRLRAALGKPRHPTQIIVSSRRAVTVRDELIFNVADVPAILITTDEEAVAYIGSAARRPWVHVIGTGTSIDLRRALDTLAREHHLPVISCVGGRTTAAALLDAGLVQDLYLTTSPESGGEPGTSLEPALADHDRALVVRKHGRGSESGVRFDHFRLSGRTSRPNVAAPPSRV
jgi:riboflavin biosynthesis pyrimidine reductase